MSRKKFPLDFQAAKSDWEKREWKTFNIWYQKREQFTHTDKKPIRLTFLILVYNVVVFSLDVLVFKIAIHIAWYTNTRENKNNHIHRSETAMCCAHDKKPCVYLFFCNTLSNQMATQQKKVQAAAGTRRQKNTTKYIYNIHAHTHTISMHTFIKKHMKNRIEMDGKIFLQSNVGLWILACVFNILVSFTVDLEFFHCT